MDQTPKIQYPGLTEYACLPHGERVHLAQQVSLTSSLGTLQAGDAPRFCEDDHPS